MFFGKFFPSFPIEIHTPFFSLFFAQGLKPTEKSDTIICDYSREIDAEAKAETARPARHGGNGR